jgi:hypothetical protein
MLTQLVLFALLRAESGIPEHAAEIPAIDVEESVPQVFAVSATQRKACPRAGVVCLSPGGAGTAEGAELRVGRAPITVLARGAQVAAVGAAHVVDVSQPWDVQLVAAFARASKDGPIVVAVLDGEDPVALADHYALAIWDVDMRPGKTLGLRFSLSPEQGFQPSRDYRLRIVQGEGKAQRILAEGDFHLE